MNDGPNMANRALGKSKCMKVINSDAKDNSRKKDAGISTYETNLCDFTILRIM